MILGMSSYHFNDDVSSLRVACSYLLAAVFKGDMQRYVTKFTKSSF